MIFEVTINKTVSSLLLVEADTKEEVLKEVLEKENLIEYSLNDIKLSIKEI